MKMKLHIINDCELTLNQSIKILTCINDSLTNYITNEINNEKDLKCAEPIIINVEQGSIIINLLIKIAINFSMDILKYLIKSSLSKKLKLYNFDIKINQSNNNYEINIHIENKQMK